GQNCCELTPSTDVKERGQNCIGLTPSTDVKERAQKNRGALAALSIVRAASTRVRFRLLTTPFCLGVRATNV
nr:hypothetical protein [Tanacetum cinerariifolium]